ncbi:MAG: HAMP domain-containing histidine kinase [Actinobacteria bacterium]|nr:HAMP domain-containing histidine kinase [Actinomycetota bacterium]
MTGAFTVVALRDSLVDSLDSSLVRRVGGPDPGPPPVRRETPAPVAPDPPGLNGQRLVVTLDGGVATAGRITDGTTTTTLDATQLDLVARTAGASPSTVDLGALGSYRVVLDSRDPAAVVVEGLPLAPIESTARRLAFIIAAASGVGFVSIAMLTGLLIGGGLRPLRRVAATATRVANQPMDAGAVEVLERVPERDTDDRTEVGRVGAALNELLDHVQESLNERHEGEQRLRQFVADASHELRTPLASIRGYAELSRRHPDEVPADVAHALARINAEADRMGTLVDDLLLLARLDSGRPLEMEPVDLLPLIIDAVADAQAAGPGHRWILKLPDEPVVVSGDRGRLVQVVVNLLSNARVHTPEGTRVTVGVQGGDGAVITVADDGPGIPADLRPNVFRRFARGDVARTRTRNSTGLGLSIVAAVVEAHGGSVEAESSPAGTVFTVTLPGSIPAS